ncbi:2-Hydroxyacid oxidase 1-like [Saccoglossus kowalevskii]|uniref:Hydroxyacid oxidase 1-like n=1 Tax=Saccoglossus kowalevskii TaxID=10224 RepID=A0ABM0GTX8_SACKO|nr:PREDICTED: hydroxyacid oxidase 1-like [Saccoglossus kowalevskii]
MFSRITTRTSSSIAANALLCLRDYEINAKKILPIPAWTFLASGADEEVTLRDNSRAFLRYKLRPRVLRNVATRDLSTTILGREIDMPICIGPTGLHTEAHKDGEVATAKGVADLNTCYVPSIYSGRLIEDIFPVPTKGPKWQQIFIWKNRDMTRDVIKRAEDAGADALVLTTDVPAPGNRLGLRRLPPGPLPKFVNLERYGPTEGITMDASVTWEYITWLKSITKLPIVLKGILTEEDAVLAAEYGINGIIVSNNGGRQLDTVPASIDVLERIAKSVGNTIEIYMDSGIRTGTDVLKALAFGAKAVFIGRPIVYGLALQGEEGVSQVLQILKDELSLAMALSGCRSIGDITPSLIMKST